MSIELYKSNIQGKKFTVIIPGSFTQSGRSCTVHFGAAGYEDYTIHKDAERKNRYIQRHASRENWNSSGICTAGFWSRWLLWEKPTLKEAIRFIEQKFKVRIKY